MGHNINVHSNVLTPLFRDVFDRGIRDADAAAAQVLAELQRNAELAAEALRQLVRAQASHELRTYINSLEREIVLNEFPDAEQTEDALSADVVGERNAWLDLTVFIPKRGRVLVGTMTAADHKTRAEWLRGQLATHVRTVQHTIDIHTAAAALIERHGVDCLNDISDEATVLLGGK